MPKISVIVPVYNTEPWLRQCLDSVLAQSFADFELILIDDGSTDGSGAICDGYAARDGRIHVIHRENAGQGRARNVAMDRATGKYLIFLDSDDYWLPSTLETLYAEAERNRTQVLCFGAILFADETGELLDRYAHVAQNGVVRSGADSIKTATDAHEYHSEAWIRFYLLDYVRESGLRFDEGIIHEDARFTFLSQLFAERVECIDAQLYMYRKRPGSTMGSLSPWNSAHGVRVGLDGLLDVYFSHTRSAEEEAQLARYCAQRMHIICGQYAHAILQSRDARDAWRAARRIRRDARKTLKRARALPSLPWSLRLAAYSPLMGWFVHGVYNRLKRLVHP